MTPCDGIGWINGWPVPCTDDDPCDECAREAAKQRHPARPPTEEKP